MKITKDFPIFSHLINKNKLTYLDSAAMSQKPQQVIDAMVDYYTRYCSNVGRGIYTIAEQTTTAFEDARAKVQTFIGALNSTEIIFTKNTTEGINFIANTWADKHIKVGDEIVLSQLEHHANLLPWQNIAKQKKATIKFIPVTKDGQLDVHKIDEIITKKTKFVGVSHVSNALGTEVNIQMIINAAKSVGAKVLIDGAQSVPHQRINVSELQCDFLVFSGAKTLGPTGIGILYIKQELHDEIEPFLRGGGIVYKADFHDAHFLRAPHRFEAGTPPIAQAIGLHAALEYLEKNINFNELQKHEAQLCARVIDGLQQYKRVRLLGPLEQLREKGHIISFVVDGVHAHDVAAFLDRFGICVRAGHHCVQPLAGVIGYESSVRVSFYCYNTHEDVDLFLRAMAELLI